MENNKQNFQEINDDWMEILGFGSTTKQLTKEELKQEKYMSEEVEVTVKIKRRDFELFKALTDYDEYEVGEKIPTKNYIGMLINTVVVQKMDYLDLIQRIRDLTVLRDKTREQINELVKLEQQFREKYDDNRVFELIPYEENFRNAILETLGLEREEL